MTEATGKASMIAQTVKNWPAMQETWVQSLGQEDPLATVHEVTKGWTRLSN